MTSPHSAARSRRWPGVRPAPAAAVCAAAAIAVAGCGSGAVPGGPPASGPASHRAAGHPMPASQALSAAASAAAKVTSYTADMSITSGGTYASRLDGTVQEQIKPALRALQKFSVTANGTTVPGGMQTLLTGNAVYLKMVTLARVVGKPWAKIPFSALRKSLGVSLAPLVHQLQGNDPLAQAQMLPAASNVRQVGPATVSGVPTTEYSGTLDIARSMARLDPSLRRLVGPGLSAAGITTARFDVWIDAQHQVRKLVETESGAAYHVTSVVTITSINQPVHIQVPPASQVASVPGL